MWPVSWSHKSTILKRYLYKSVYVIEALLLRSFNSMLLSGLIPLHPFHATFNCRWTNNLTIWCCLTDESAKQGLIKINMLLATNGWLPVPGVLGHPLTEKLFVQDPFRSLERRQPKARYSSLSRKTSCF